MVWVETVGRECSRAVLSREGRIGGVSGISWWKGGLLLCIDEVRACPPVCCLQLIRRKARAGCSGTNEAATAASRNDVVRLSRAEQASEGRPGEGM